VAPEDEAAFEAEEEVLPDRLDALEAPSVELLRDAGQLPPRMRSLDLEALADEDAQPSRRAMERISLRHAAQRSPVRA
jgi:hypothetical protein